MLPPLGVFLERGCGADLLINLLLTILGCKFMLLSRHRLTSTFQNSGTDKPSPTDIPGIIHALYIILKY